MKKSKKNNLKIMTATLFLLLGAIQTSEASTKIKMPILELNDAQMDSISAGVALATATSSASASSPIAITVTKAGTIAGSNKYADYAASYAAAAACCANQTVSATANTSTGGRTINYSQNTNSTAVAWSVSFKVK